MQDADSEQAEHTGHAHLTTTDVGLLKGQSVQPVNGVISRYGGRLRSLPETPKEL